MRDALDVLNRAIETHAKSAVVKHSQILSNVLLQAFDLRRVQLSSHSEDSFEQETVDELEGLANEVAIKMIYKLNDSAFRPIFANFVEWATNGLAPHDSRGIILRKRSLYGFLLKFFNDLKVGNCLRIISDHMLTRV